MPETAMNITVTDQQQCKKQIRVEIPADNVREETDKIAAELGRRVNVPGFRRGHVPTSVVKTRFRKELRDEVLSHLLPHVLGDAIREKDLKVVGEPSIEDLKFGEDQSIDVTFSVEVLPEFEMSDYKNLSLTKRVYKVRDEDVDKAIDHLRRQQTELVPVEDRGAQAGDLVSVNISGKFEPAPAAGPGQSQQAQDQQGQKAEDQPAEGQQAEDRQAEESRAEDRPAEAGAQEPERTEASQPDAAQADAAQAEAGRQAAGQEEEIKQDDVQIEIGGEGVFKEFSDALTGARTGDVRTFTVEYPAEYGAERYAGRRVTYTAEVVAVRAKEMPEANDEFARSVNEQFKTLDELRADIRSKLEHDVRHKSEDELRNQVMEQLVDRNQFEVPGFIIEKQMDSRVRQFINQMAGQGMDPRQFQLDWRKLRESQRERAEREVRGSLVLGKIAELEKIEVGEDELDREVEKLAESFGQEPAAMRARLTKDGALDSIKEQVRNRKALDIVIASADLKTEEIEGLSKEDAASDNEGGQAEG